MGKKKKSKTWDNVDFKTWEYEKQTEMKHKVFSDYLPKWLSILGSKNNNLNFVDGFGGIGAYHTDEDINRREYISNNFGSPILSIQAIYKLKKDNKIDKANIFIIDKEEENIKNLKKILNYLKIKKDKNTEIKRDNFDKKVNGILDFIDVNDSYKLAPTFFLLDPFGFKGIKYETLKRIMSNDRTEILLNFMYTRINQFLSSKELSDIFRDLFGNYDWGKIVNLKGEEREREIIKYCRGRFKNFSKYVYPFKLKFPYKNKTYYYLIHLTNHWKGCSEMKNSFAKFNHKKDEYCGEHYQSSLFDSIDEKEKIENFKNKIIDSYKGRGIRFDSIISEIIDKTNLLYSEIGDIFKELEKEEKIKIKTFDNRKRKGGRPNEKDLIKFI